MFHIPARPAQRLRRFGALLAWPLLLALFGAFAGGCRQHPSSSEQADARQQAEQKARAAQAGREKARQQLDQIPPPAKTRYLAVRTQDAWANPFLSVGPRDLTLRVLMPDANPSDLGKGGLMRLSNARRQTLTIRLADLPDALTAIPVEAWPYGRVIAITELPTTEKPLRPQIRRNVEATIQVLNDLGLVVDEWSGPNGGPLR